MYKSARKEGGRSVQHGQDKGRDRRTAHPVNTDTTRPHDSQVVQIQVRLDPVRLLPPHERARRRLPADLAEEPFEEELQGGPVQLQGGALALVWAGGASVRRLAVVARGRPMYLTKRHPAQHPTPTRNNAHAASGAPSVTCALARCHRPECLVPADPGSRGGSEGMACDSCNTRATVCGRPASAAWRRALFGWDGVGRGGLGTY